MNQWQFIGYPWPLHSEKEYECTICKIRLILDTRLSGKPEGCSKFCEKKDQEQKETK